MEHTADLHYTINGTFVDLLRIWCVLLFYTVHLNTMFNSLTTGRWSCYLKWEIHTKRYLKHFLWNCPHVNLAILTDDSSRLIEVMAWCHQVTSNYLYQGWSWYMSAYGVTRPQGTKLLVITKIVTIMLYLLSIELVCSLHGMFQFYYEVHFHATNIGIIIILFPSCHWLHVYPPPSSMVYFLNIWDVLFTLGCSVIPRSLLIYTFIQLIESELT